MSASGGTRSLGLPGLKTAAQLVGDLRGAGVTRMVGLSAIDVMPGFNHRGQGDPAAFTPARLEGLAASIRRVGVLAPLILRPNGLRFDLIAGERRYRAAQLAGLTEIPAVVRPLSDGEARAVSLMENLQREDVSLVEQTIAGFALMELVTGLTHPQLVAHLNQLRNGTAEDQYELAALLQETFGTSVSTWAQTRARLMQLRDSERLAVIHRQAEAGTLLPLTALPAEAPEREALFQRVLREGLSAAEVRHLVSAARQATRPASIADSVRRHWPRLKRLDGERRQRAEALLRELDALLSEH